MPLGSQFCSMIYTLVLLLSLQVFADKEVILSGGAINSPQLLMLSGVGNADDLKQLDIPVVQHLPGTFCGLKRTCKHLKRYISTTMENRNI